jgi:LemA protein
MNTLLIIGLIIAILLIALWTLLVLNNDATKNADEGFIIFSITFLLFVLPGYLAIFCANGLKMTINPLSYHIVNIASIPAYIVTYFSSKKALNNYLLQTQEKIKTLKLKVDTEYKNRFEVIPNLVKIIKSCTENENSTIDKVLQTHKKVMQKEAAPEDKKELNKAMNSMIFSTYSYPQLQTMPMYRSLMANLNTMQENISYYTSDYNKEAAKFNGEIKSFPVNKFTKKLDIQPFEYLDNDVTIEQKNASNLLADL